MRRLLFLLPILSLSLANAADVVKSTSTVKLQKAGNGYLYARPGLVDFVTKMPGDTKDVYHIATSSGAKKTWIFIAASTGLLIWGDQWMLDEVQKFGKRQGITQESHQYTYTSIYLGSNKINLGGPKDL